MDDVIEYLRSKGLQVHRAAGHEVTVHCTFCSDGDPKGKGKLYVNAETWLFDCKRCGASGGRKMLMEHFGDQLDTATFVPGANPAARRQVLGEYTTLAAEMLAANEQMTLYLLRRGLDGDTILKARLGYIPRSFSACRSLPTEHPIADLKASGMLTESGREFHSGRIVIPYLSRGSVLQVRGKDPAAKYFTPTGDSVRLYNQDALRDADYVIVTEGEFDCLILEQHLLMAADPRVRRIAIVGLPGAGVWPGGKEGFADYFRDAKRVYIGFDPDDTGKREALKLKELLGSKARVIELPDLGLVDSRGNPVKCDWTEYLRAKDDDHPYGGHTVADVVGLVDAAEMLGKRLYSMREAVSVWRKEQNESPGIKTGYPALDALIAPGLKPGNLCIPLAKTGVGKTVFLANLAYNMRSHRVLFVSLEQMTSEITELLVRIHRFRNPLAEPEELAAIAPWLAIVDENRLTTEDFSLLIEEYIEQYGERPEVVMVDYVGYYARGFRGGKSYERVSAAVMQLKAEAKTHRVAVIAPHQVSRGAQEGKVFEAGDARDSGVIEETGDFVFGLFKPDDAIDNATPGMVTGRLMVKILKSRKGNKNKTIPLQFSAASLAVVDGHDGRAVAQVEQENAAINQGLHYGKILANQRDVANQRRQTQLRIVGVA